MPTRTLTDFLAGFFYSSIGAKQVTTYKAQGSAAVKKIKVEMDKRKEVAVVQYEKIAAKWKRWNYEDFLRVWNKTYLK